MTQTSKERSMYQPATTLSQREALDAGRAARAEAFAEMISYFTHPRTWAFGFVPAASGH